MTAAAYTWTPLIITHAAVAATCVVLGAVLLWWRKGHLAHRVGGWAWVLGMAGVAGVSFGIRGAGGFSWIHGLSVFTLLTLFTGVAHARAHRIKAHRINMIALYVGALVVTGLFTLLPGRLLGKALWGGLGLA
jgi:uncharacterized membrane protein